MYTKYLYRDITRRRYLYLIQFRLPCIFRKLPCIFRSSFVYACVRASVLPFFSFSLVCSLVWSWFLLFYRLHPAVCAVWLFYFNRPTCVGSLFFSSISCPLLFRCAGMQGKNTCTDASWKIRTGGCLASKCQTWRCVSLPKTPDQYLHWTAKLAAYSVFFSFLPLFLFFFLWVGKSRGRGIRTQSHIVG